MTARRRRSRSTKSPGNTPSTDVAPDNLTDYRYPETRKNNPPAGLAAQGRISEVPKQRYSYDPHLPPVLRFDSTGEADELPQLLQEAQRRPLTAEEAQLLADALRHHQPWLEWAGKQEKRWFEVDPVALHTHERVSAQAIMRIAARQDVQRSLWGDPEQEYREAVQFYRHDVDWANRLILGDNLVVMNSLAKREDLAGKVQMIYIDPPYGIRFGSNFQPTIGNRDVRDRPQDLTREPEMVKAFRDTWSLGVHSYLAYLRDRLITAKELLADTGSIFVQIGDENLHRVRAVMDEVFGSDNFISIITYRTSVGLGAEYLDNVNNHLIWYSRVREAMKCRPLYKSLVPGERGATRYQNIEFPDGTVRRLIDEEKEDSVRIPTEGRLFRDQGMTSRSGSVTTTLPFTYNGRTYYPRSGGWRTSAEGMHRLSNAERLLQTGDTLSFKKFFDDFPALAITNFWDDVSGGITSRADPKIFVVQTATKIIERCILMATDPGDLVMDPTCGSGTTAYVAEQWGRRWITVDTSRVAISLARQRILTARFDHYKTRDGSNQLHDGSFIYKPMPHITLRSIAQNTALDPIFAKWEPALKEKLEALNVALQEVTSETRARLQAKVAGKERREGKRAITEADRRRWLLPSEGWQEWEVPFDADTDWPDSLQQALNDYRKTWREKMDEVNACIAASAEQVELVDQPEVERGVVRVSGPFTVEAVQPLEDSLEEESPFGGEPEQLDTFEGEPVSFEQPANAEAYLNRMLRLLRKDGVRFPDNNVIHFDSLTPLEESTDWLHAEGEWGDNGNGGTPRRVAVSFGPQYGPVTAVQVEECLAVASRRGYNDLVFAGFSFDGAAQAIIQEDPNPRVRVHMAHIRPDANPSMGELLKDTPDSQLFTVFGLPRTELHQNGNDEWVVEMQGVDVYNPVDNSVASTGADKVAAWFLDSDYDGRTFCISQAFFPDARAWQNLARSLKGVIDEDKFATFGGTTSLPFPAGQHHRVAVKVIDPRGNEVMRLHSLNGRASNGEAQG